MASLMAPNGVTLLEAATLVLSLAALLRATLAGFALRAWGIVIAGWGLVRLLDRQAGLHGRFDLCRALCRGGGAIGGNVARGFLRAGAFSAGRRRCRRFARCSGTRRFGCRFGIGASCVVGFFGIDDIGHGQTSWGRRNYRKEGVIVVGAKGAGDSEVPTDAFNLALAAQRRKAVGVE